ncbi:DUF1178 family protein [Paracoccus alkanivorans]|uniref:DUF1178 family protein n=1 Tax=Paracoccus alkanivorans TaxID=2116655 RepID=A0A3M0M8Y0_9RHOB|nr:DUF1178 family protein [Paracoccus alkanivorans]RMC32030.1 DUF1178 family protein [Paracoccus alkanivorans]
MIRYALRCDKGHDFDGWFRSSEGFEAMRGSGQVACAQCGSTSVEKALMAPSVPAEKMQRLNVPRNPAEVALEKLREHVEKNSDYVGLRFADEARAMHEGERPSRAIHGEARPEDARKLIEDGVPVAPLPFIPRQKAN